MDNATINRTDAELQQDVLAELGWDARVRPNEIGVTVQDGVVTLTAGSIPCSGSGRRRRRCTECEALPRWRTTSRLKC